MAVAPIQRDAPIRKFGQIIGFASRPIAPGEWVHEHNCVVKEFARDYHFGEDARPETIAAVEHQPTFQGFRRPNGKVGTRNYLAILTSVNCSATTARLIAREVERSGMLADYPNVDGVIALVHGTGCGMASKGEGFEALMRTEWGYAANPNVGATLMVGLGCEVFQIGRMKEEYGLVESDDFQSLTIQATGGTRKTIDAGIERLRAMLPRLDRARREPAPASALTLALQCGGSDGYSGITANPALGAAADILVRNGGTAILSETPEIYGAEHLLTRRAATAGSGSSAGRTNSLVGRLLRPQRRRDEQQSLSRQQGGRLDDNFGEVAWSSGERRHDAAERGLQVRRAGRLEGLRIHGYARL